MSQTGSTARRTLGQRFPPQVVLLSGVLLGAGFLHFVSPKPFDAIIPRLFPDDFRRPLTYASGAAEMAAGALLLNPGTRRVGGRVAQVLFIAILPANVSVAMTGGYDANGFLGTTTAAWLRVPLQIPLILWAGWAGRSSASPGEGDT